MLTYYPEHSPHSSSNSNDRHLKACRPSLLHSIQGTLFAGGMKSLISHNIFAKLELGEHNNIHRGRRIVYDAELLAKR